MASATANDDIVAEIPTYIRVYKNGTVERPRQTPFVPPSLHDPQTGVSSKDVVISDNPSISARLYLPKSTHQKLPILVYFHGGGFFFESAFSRLYHNYFTSFVSRVNVVVVSVEYRLAPEHYLPAAYDDCWDALKWVARCSTKVPNDEPWLNHGDFDRIFIGGDSAGGNIVHNIAMRAGVEDLPGGIRILGAIYVHPYFYSSKPIGSEPVSGHEQSLPYLVWDFVYPSAPGGIDNPMVNPLAPGAPSLAGLGCCKILVCVASKDSIRDRGVWFYEGVIAMDVTELNSQRRPFSIKLWPPSQNTRQMLVERMSNNLTAKSIFTQKYGVLNKEEAEENARRIEDMAFVTANLHYEKEPDGDGGSAVQLYAKECSKLLLDVLKRGPSNKDNIEKVTSNSVTASRESVFDISKGKRAFIEAEEAQELLKPLKEPGNSFTKICFSNRSFGVGAAQVAQPILTSVKDQLKEVDLSDFIAGRSEEEALDVMNIFSAALEGSSLKYLNLSDNALGEKGVRAFGALLKSQTCLEELYLMNDGISEEAAQAVCELIPSTEKLRVLHFHNNMTGDEGALAIAEVVKRSPLLENFRCSSTRIGSEGGVALCDSLGNCAHLKKLDLQDNMFDVNGAISLSKALTKHAELREINLGYLNLEDEGAIAIVNALKDSAPHLEILEMSGNEITVEAAPAIASCVAAKQFLMKLNLSENELKDEGAIEVSKAIEGLVHLKEIDLSSNKIRRAGARQLAQTVVQKADFKLLNIDGNFISDEGIDEVKDMFKKFPDMLGPLAENDPDGVDDDDDDEEGERDEQGSGDELEPKMKNLEVS
ncbi:RAN GTPase-activating protein 2 [Senna tora]|uniref:RAN GTPase-activating protein 2 n=1 Tax=Senna tora TaxID=362788 RepID=A0A834T0V3_9FABA|nr:RAN GTPase-activating protein 2 [Senna tora]